MGRRFLLAASLAAPLLLLGGCAGRAPAPVYTNPVLPSYWEAEGKAAVRSRDRGGNLYFTWTQNGPAWRLVVRGPLGLGHAELHGRPGLVRLLADGMKQEVSANSPEELLEKATQRSAPVSHALHWMKAEPATAHARIRRDEQGRPSEIREDGWTVTYLDWSEEAPLLPRRLTLEGPDGRATVVIGLWRLALDPAQADLDRQGNTVAPGSAAATCCGHAAAPPAAASPAGSGHGPASATPHPPGKGPATPPRPARDPATVLPLAPLDNLPEPAL